MTGSNNNFLKGLCRPHPAIWPTRAPYAYFLEKHQHLNRSYRVTRIAYRLSEGICSKFSSGALIDEVIVPLLAFPEKKQDISKYVLYAPQVGDMVADLKSQYELLDQIIMMRNSTLFEALMLSWCCNMFLATLENGQRLIPEQLDLVECVARKGRIPFPRKNEGKNRTFFVNGVTQIIDAFPGVKEELEEAPRRKKNPQTQKEETPPHHLDANALRIVEFWQDVRNLVVHNEGIVNPMFFRKQNHLWEILRSDLSFVPELREDAPIPLNGAMVTASLTTHALLAKKLRDILIRFSKERRGHVFAPGPFRGIVPQNQMPKSLPPLYMSGDWEPHPKRK